jgi:hypothetical protein
MARGALIKPGRIGNYTRKQLDAIVAAEAATITAQGDITAVTTSTTSGLDGGATTGAAALTIAPERATDGTVASGDYVLIADVNDSNNLKRVTAGSIATLAGGGSISMSSNTDADNVIITSDGTNGKAIQQANATISTGGQSLTVQGTLTLADSSGNTNLTISESGTNDCAFVNTVNNRDIIFKGKATSGTSEIFRIDSSAESLLIAESKKILLGNAEEYIYGDGTDIHIGVGSGGDVNIAANIGLTFGQDAEKIEGDGSGLTISGGVLTLDSVGDITLDAGGANVFFKDDGTTFLDFQNSSGDAIIVPGASTKDVIFKCHSSDNSGAEVMRLDSSAGLIQIGTDRKLAFSNANEYIYSDGTDLFVGVGSGGDINLPADIGLAFGDDGEKIEGNSSGLTITGAALTLDSEGDIILDADGGDVFFKDGGTTFLDAKNSSGNVILAPGASTKDIIFKCHSDDNSGAEVFRVDSSEGTLLLPTGKKVAFSDTGEYISGDGTDLTIGSGRHVTIDARGDIILDADGDDIRMQAGSDDATGLTFTHSNSGDWTIKPGVQDKDLIIQSNTAGNATEMLRVDASTARIGIKTAAPAALLEVAGTVSGSSFYASENMQVSGALNCASTINAANTVSGSDAYFVGNLGISGSFSVGSSLTATGLKATNTLSGTDGYYVGNSVISGTLTSGKTIRAANALSSSDGYFSGDLDVSGTISATKYSSITSITTVSGSDAYYTGKLNVSGNLGFADSSNYINFGNTEGTTGYGIRDNAGFMQFRDSAGTWKDFAVAALEGTGSSVEQIQDIVGDMFTSNSETNITTTYVDNDGKITLVASAAGNSVTGSLEVSSGFVGVSLTGSYITHGVTLPNKSDATGSVKANAFLSYSSRRYKEDIVPIEDPISKVKNLQGVSFAWKSSGDKDIGFIAEDVGEIIPEIVSFEENGVDASSMDYPKLTALLVEAVKEQQKRIEKLENMLLVRPRGH